MARVEVLSRRGCDGGGEQDKKQQDIPLECQFELSLAHWMAARLFNRQSATPASSRLRDIHPYRVFAAVGW